MELVSSIVESSDIVSKNLLLLDVSNHSSVDLCLGLLDAEAGVVDDLGSHFIASDSSLLKELGLILIDSSHQGVGVRSSVHQASGVGISCGFIVLVLVDLLNVGSTIVLV